MKILVTPLNWGLGHATRCIPLMWELQSRGATVIIGSDGAALDLLQKEFPQLIYHTLSGYNVNYAGDYLTYSIIRQSWKIQKAIKQEYLETQKIVELENIDLIISDNRYGCRHTDIPSYIITHQTNILTGLGMSTIATNIISRYLRKFDEVWIPDYPGANSLSGILSLKDSSYQSHHIGPLTRLKNIKMPAVYDIAVILSGPEPSRTDLEEDILVQCQALPHLNIIIVRGVISTEIERNKINNVEIVNYMTSAELNEVISSSNLIVSRSGYSSLMDYSSLTKKVLFIPTKGQPEQEYLGKLCKKNNWANVHEEGQVNLLSAYKNRNNYGFNANQGKNHLLAKRLNAICNQKLA